MESCRTNCSEYREAGCRRSKHVPRSGRKETELGSLILKRANTSRLSGRWSDDDYDVLENGIVVGRIFKVPVPPQDRPLMWASGHNGRYAGPRIGMKPRWLQALDGSGAPRATTCGASCSERHCV
jgi:hypothetical protein